MTHSRPRITGTTHTLPFDRLSPRDFERLCLWLVEREGYERAEHLGAAGSEQGRDVVAYKPTPHGVELWYFQCKRYSSIYPGTLKREVDKYVRLAQDKLHLRPAGVVFVISCALSAKVREEVGGYCEQHGLAYEFWAHTELDMLVKQHPDIVEEFFQVAGRRVIPRILGIGSDERRALRNRRAMLELVRNFWVEGVLEKSLHGAAMIELGMEEKPGAVEYPWDMVLQTGREDHTLSPGAKIIDVFDEVGRNLLILGEPGSGKTTMLLELARDTIARAEEDPMQPIPVVFNLSSWADERQPIAEWLVDELNSKYNIPKKVARPWVEFDELLLLLDGLDEVALRCREDCVRAINDFCQEHLVPLLVCSRVADYEALTARLRLQGAVLLRPLTLQQIDEYLGGAGIALSAVRGTLQYDPTLQELAETPLMLSIMTLAYRGVSVEDLQALNTPEARRQHLFGAYVRRMFERRGVDQPYSPRQTIRWLAWLAHKMSQHAQTVFLIERIQPSWLPSRVLRWLYVVVFALVGGLSVGLIGGTSIGAVFERVSDISGGARGWMIGGAIGGVSVGSIVGLRAIRPVELLRWSWRQLRKRAIRILIGGLIGGLTGGLVVALISVVIFLGQGEDFSNALLVGLIVGPGIGLGIGLFMGLGWGLSSGLRAVEIETRIRPNQGVWQSARNALTLGLLTGIIGALSLGLVLRLGFGLSGRTCMGIHGWLSDGLDDGLFSGWKIGGILGSWVAGEADLSCRLGFGLSIGLFFGLAHGGDAVIKHCILRLILSFRSHIPWNYARFLDYAAERILLRKVGGGYIFIHRSLQSYFASLYQYQ